MSGGWQYAGWADARDSPINSQCSTSALVSCFDPLCEHLRRIGFGPIRASISDCILRRIPRQPTLVPPVVAAQSDWPGSCEKPFSGACPWTYCAIAGRNLPRSIGLARILYDMRREDIHGVCGQAHVRCDSAGGVPCFGGIGPRADGTRTPLTRNE